MTRPATIVTPMKQYSLRAAKFPGLYKDTFVMIEHAEGVLQVPASTSAISWGKEDPEAPKAPAGKVA